jgi:NADPH:quinone reductase
MPIPDVRAIVQPAALPLDDERSLIDTTVTIDDPRAHDLLVEVHAVSVNPVDVKLRSGSAPTGRGRVLGFDAAGTVRAVGADVTLFRPGDEVFYAGAIDRPGSNSALQLVDERVVGRKPSTLSAAEAAALPLTALTAWEALFDKLRIASDDRGTLLIVGGAGGVGSLAIQLARALLPHVRVIATASRPDSARWVRELGAHDVVDHHGDLRAQLAVSAAGGVSWILSTNSIGQLPVYVDVLRPFGQIVAIDDPRTLDVVPLKSKALSWHWEFMFARSMHGAPDLIRQHEILERVADLVEAGRVRSTTTTTLSGIDARTLRAAHALVESGRVIGKVVLSDEN